MVVTVKKLHDLWTTVSLISLSTGLRINEFRHQARRENCAHSCCAQRHLTPAHSSSLQLISAYSSQSDLPRILWTLVSVWTISM